MPLQNRVAPDGSIVAVSDRGTLMGNRGGRIHDAKTRTLLKRRWVGRRWICCELEFKNRQRVVMGNSYTELFFLDEVTALAAGHRPCFECRHKDARVFADFWNQQFPLKRGSVADQIDSQLQPERTGGVPTAQTVKGRDLIPGVIYIAMGRYFTKRHDRLLEWGFSGYSETSKDLDRAAFRQVTPPSMVEVLAAGYQPRWHGSADDPKGE